MRSLILIVLMIVVSCAYKKTVNKPINETIETIIKEKTVFVHDTITVENNCAPVKIVRVVFFDFDSYSLSEKAKAVLDNVNSQKAVIIRPHSCDIGTSEYNHTLRSLRAEAVRKYLKRGLDECMIFNNETGCRTERELCRNVEIISYE